MGKQSSLKKSTSSGGGASHREGFQSMLKHGLWKEYQYHMYGVIGAIVVLFVAILVTNVMLSANSTVHYIDVSNLEQVTRVFRSGEPWFVVCLKPQETLPEVVAKAHAQLLAVENQRKDDFDISVAIMDCQQKLPTTGQSVLDRFKIRSHIQPTVFTVAKGEKPKQIFLNALKNEKLLYDEVRKNIKKTLVQFMNSVKLEANCLKKSNCGVILRGTNKFSSDEKRWINALMREYPKMTMGWIDSTSSTLDIPKTSTPLPEYKQGQNRFLLFKHVNNNAKASLSNYSVKAFTANDFEYLPIKQFLAKHVTMPLEVLSKVPTISRRRVSPPTPHAKTKDSRKKQRSHKSETNTEKKEKKVKSEEKEASKADDHEWNEQEVQYDPTDSFASLDSSHSMEAEDEENVLLEDE